MKNQEENIKKALEAEVPQWNENLVWDKIEDEMHPKKKKRFFFWLFFGIALLVTSVATILIWEQQPEIIKPTKETSVTKKKASKIPTQPTIKKVQTSQSENILIASTATNTAQVKQNIENRTTTRTNEGQEKSKTNSSFPQKEASFYSRLAEPSLALIPSETPTLFSPKAFNSKTRAGNNKIKPLELSSSLIAFAPNYINFPTDINTSTLITPSKVQQKIKRNSIVFSAGVYQSYRQLSSISNPAWLSAKKEMDIPLETVDLSLGLRHFITNKFYVAAGIGLSQTVEMMSSIDSTITVENVPVDTAIIHTDDFQSYYISGELSQTTTQKRTTRTPNRYQAIYLPISLGYQFQSGKWAVQLSSGIDIELSRRYKGKVLNFDQSIDSNESIDKYYFNDSVSIANLTFRSSINYDITDKISFSIGLGYKYGMLDYLASQNHTLRYNKLGCSFNSSFRL